MWGLHLKCDERHTDTARYTKERFKNKALSDLEQRAGSSWHEQCQEKRWLELEPFNDAWFQCSLAPPLIKLSLPGGKLRIKTRLKPFKVFQIFSLDLLGFYL